ncbi:hypothetical protein [Dysgonomonas sp. 511]|uniref:hypothetical protein n=1 Tax=Dysgonomonas sp. 511 TaxID=2302930 RepID=UPI0013D2C3F9|nr:hypothetical protein [Dysgonomonas sp. 511]NDV79758.1 hypothetical protein [Dysgonomonas sp. 511]
MNKLLFVFITVFLSVNLSGQDIKDKSISLDLKQIPGILNPLTKENKIKYVVPEKLQYWKSGTMYINNYLGDIPAKQERGDKPVDYTFELVTSGFDFLGDSGPVAFEGGTKVIEITYSYPCQLQVKDASGNIVKTFIVDDGSKEHKTTYHPDFFSTNNFMGVAMENKPTKGFSMANDKLLEKYEKEKEDIFARAEFNKLREYAYACSDFIPLAYGEVKTSKPNVMTIEKKYKEKFPELDSSIEKLTVAIETVYTGKYDDNLKSEFNSLGDYFASQYNESSSKQMRKICSYNAAMAYAMGSSFDKAYQQYGVAEDLFGIFSGSTGAFENIFDKMLSVDFLRNTKDADVVMLGELPTIAYRKNEVRRAENDKINAAIAARLAENIVKKQGYVITKDGERIDGVISVKFVETPKEAKSNIMDMSLGKVVDFENSEAKLYKKYKMGDIRCFVVGDARYDVVKENDGAGAKVLSVVLTGSKGDKQFVKRIGTAGKYVAYYSPMYEYYLIALVDDESQNEYIGYSLSKLRGNGKDAKEFIGDCPALVEKIGKKEISNTQEGAIEVITLLAKCKK